MKDKLRSAMILALTVIVLLFTSNRLPADTGTCGGAMTTLPFTDVAENFFFCQIAEAYFSGHERHHANNLQPIKPGVAGPDGRVHNQDTGFGVKTGEPAGGVGAMGNSRRAADDQQDNGLRLS